MVVKIYISGISGNKEVKKRQQRVLMILDSKNIKYDVIDITEPGREADKDFMQNNSKSNGGTVSDPNPRSPLPPQVFNDDEYCGDYDQFDLANEVDTLEQFLKVEAPPEEPPVTETEQEKVVNGDVAKEKENESKENSQERETGDGDKAEEKTEDAPKEKTPSREQTPADRVASKEPSPAKDDEVTPATKEESPAKETSPERQKSVEKEEVTEKEKSPVKEVELESKKSSKEASPEKEESVNENGAVSSREPSEEKEPTEEVVESKKDNPSEALIASEQAAASE